MSRSRTVLTALTGLMTWLLAGPASAELLPMSAGELTSVTAREGIAFEWDLMINTDETGDPNALGLPLVEKRLALKFAGRNDGGGEWIVLKNITGRLNFPRFTLDASLSSPAPSAHADTSRFDGAPIYGQPNLQVTFPEDIEIYNFTIGGAAIEYGATGYLLDNNGSFLGLRIDNAVPDQPGTIQAEGTMSIYGF